MSTLQTTNPGPRRLDRRLLLLVGAVVFVDTMFYAAITPLLPTLVRDLHLTKLSAGLMSAGYPVGALLAAIPGGLLAARTGPRATVCAGLGLLAVSTLAFGVLDSTAGLDTARVAEGVGGACSWAGGLAWLVADAPPERRGGLIGRAMAAAIGGSLFGPVIGSLATTVGRGPAFGAVVVLAVLLAVAALRTPDRPASGAPSLARIRTALRGRRVRLGMWLVTLPAIAAGLVNVLGPLRLHELGGGATAIGSLYLLAAAAETAISPFVGTFSDRRGRLVPVRFGLLITAVLLLGFTVPVAPLAMAALVFTLIMALGVQWAPAMALLSDAAELSGLDQGLAAALMNLAWATGQVLGAGAGGALARAAGDLAPAAGTAALCAATLGLIRGSRSAADAH